ncbi:MAG: cyclohexa-1,5-dienecarbonyl-CoA hydratase [Planctomycetota bacterium]
MSGLVSDGVSSQPSMDFIRTAELEGGAILRVTINRPKANILDRDVIEALTDFFESVKASARIKAVILEGAGEHFSFGASVQEHRLDQVEGMLKRFHDLLRCIAKSGVIVLAAVRGMCLGGGLELAAFCQRIFAQPESKFGQPEIALGVFAPVASLFLRDRVGAAHADDLLLTGRIVDAEEALKMGLIDELSDDSEQSALAWVTEHLLPGSASSLRFATRAARFESMQRFEQHIGGIEKLYLEELMKTPDASEGLEAFLKKRQPKWS